MKAKQLKTAMAKRMGPTRAQSGNNPIPRLQLPHKLLHTIVLLHTSNLHAVDAENDTLRVQLLSDIRGEFKDVDLLSSEDLTSALISLDDRPWADYSRGKPLTMAKLARLLRPFGVVSGSVRLPDDRTPKGICWSSSPMSSIATYRPKNPLRIGHKTPRRAMEGRRPRERPSCHSRSTRTHARLLGCM
jgi:hypothetical protein